MIKKSYDYQWCEVYGGPRDGLWCGTGKVSQQGGKISFCDVDGRSHYYVLITVHTYNAEKNRMEPLKTFFAYAGTDPDALMNNVIIGYPGCAANNYDPDDEPDWYNPDWDK